MKVDIRAITALAKVANSLDHSDVSELARKYGGDDSLIEGVMDMISVAHATKQPVIIRDGKTLQFTSSRPLGTIDIPTSKTMEWGDAIGDIRIAQDPNGVVWFKRHQDVWEVDNTLNRRGFFRDSVYDMYRRFIDDKGDLAEWKSGQKVEKIKVEIMRIISFSPEQMVLNYEVPEYGSNTVYVPGGHNTVKDALDWAGGIQMRSVSDGLEESQLVYDTAEKKIRFMNDASF